MRISDWSSDVCSSDLDVAAIAGVSPITASRVVSGKMNVDSELAARVRSAVDKLGYRPDPSARALASAKSTHVVVLVPMLSNTLFTDLLEAIQESMWKAGYRSEEHTSELQSLMRISYAVFCLKKKKKKKYNT